MAGKRKAYTAAFKAQVALAALKGDKTIAELSSQFGVHATLISERKKLLLGSAASVFESGGTAKPAVATDNSAELYEQIGRLKVELDFVKKKSQQLGVN